jgi:succinate dehydrogenase/fumarate reductase flavoprotein subunit
VTEVSTATADVVVVGGGMGGLVAAVAAAEEGAEVVLVEKASEPGGSLALSGGYVWTFPSFSDYRRLVPHGDPDLGGALVADFDTAVEWLVDHGGRLGSSIDGLGPDRAGVGRRLEPDPVTAAVRPLLNRLSAAGGSLLTGHRGVALEMDADGGVVGVGVRERGVVRTVTSPSVVLATGGFQGDVEMMCRYVSPWADRALLRASPHCTGDGLRLALAAGASVSRGLSAAYAHVMPLLPGSLDPGSFRAMSQFYVEACILLNLRGERFVDEGRSEAVCGLALLREPEATGMIVFDEASHRSRVMDPYVPDATRSDPVERIRDRGGEVLQSDALDDLCRRMAGYGVASAPARATIAGFDRAAAGGDSGALPVPRSGELARISEPPFFAVPVRAAVTFTEGGIRTDLEGRALDRDGQPVPGLFVAGVDVGNVSNVGYAGALSAGLVTGLRAGIHAARRAAGIGHRPSAAAKRQSLPA